MTSEKLRKPILSGLRVLDLGHQYAAANCCSILADLGADVLQVEHPSGGPIRNMQPKKGEHSLWWKVVERGKKHVTLNLSNPRGRELLLKIAKDYDVLVENFRPGTLEKWGLGPADLEKAGLNLTMVRISGFGQTGPYSPQPGYGSAAEAMSGFAHMNGYPDGPPMFPSSTLADGVASLWGVIGTLASLYGTRQTPAAWKSWTWRFTKVFFVSCRRKSPPINRPASYRRGPAITSGTEARFATSIVRATADGSSSPPRVAPFAISWLAPTRRN